MRQEGRPAKLTYERHWDKQRPIGLPGVSHGPKKLPMTLKKRFRQELHAPERGATMCFATTAGCFSIEKCAQQGEA